MPRQCPMREMVSFWPGAASAVPGLFCVPLKRTLALCRCRRRKKRPLRRGRSWSELYVRVLGALAPRPAHGDFSRRRQRRAGGCAQFAEPMLFGRIIDRLTRPATTARPGPTCCRSAPPGRGFGLFVIGCAAVVALHADRLSHRRRLGMMAAFFEHVLHLPLSFHGATHSGRLLKVMLEGANGMAGLWLSFFRDHCAALVALGVLMPLVAGRELAARRACWCCSLLVFGCLTALVLRKTEGLQGRVEALPDRLRGARRRRPRQCVRSSRASPASRPKRARHARPHRRAARAPSCRCCRGGRWRPSATRAASTLTILAIFALGLTLHFRGLATHRRHRGVHGLRDDADRPARAGRGLPERAVPAGPKLARLFRRARHPASRARPAGRSRSGPAARPRRLRGCRFSYDGVRDAVVGPRPSRPSPARRSRWSARPDRASRPRSGCCIGSSIPGAGRITIDGIDIRDMPLAQPAPQRSAWCSRSRCCSPARSRRTCGSASRTRREPRSPRRCDRPRPSDFVARQPRASRRRSANAAASLSGGERQRLGDRPRAAQEPADPGSRRGDQRPRRGDRAQAASGAGGRDAGPHDLRDRPPPRHDPAGRPHPGLRRRAGSSSRAATTGCSPRMGVSRSL